MIKHLKDNENFNDLIKNDVLVDFYANWCGPCQMLTSNLEKLDYNILEVDVDKFQEIAINLGIMSVPTLVLYKNGKIIKQKSGYQELEDLEKFVGE